NPASSACGDAGTFASASRRSISRSIAAATGRKSRAGRSSAAGAGLAPGLAGFGSSARVGATGTATPRSRTTSATSDRKRVMARALVPQAGRAPAMTRCRPAAGRVRDFAAGSVGGLRLEPVAQEVGRRLVLLVRVAGVDQ